MRGRVARRVSALQASYETIVVNTRGLPRRRTLHGRQYLVVDATILREGVLNGSRGPLYYPPDEIEANPGVWNHVPIVAWHPKDANGNPTLARHPEVLEEYGLGLLFNDAYDHTARTRNVEAWFDEARTANFDRRLKDEHKVLPRLRAGVPIELSTVLFTDNVPGVGTFNAPSGTPKGYTHTARNYRPDHLAALPDQPGACSVLDGCGFNVNAKDALGHGSDKHGGESGTEHGLPKGFNQDHENVLQSVRTHGSASPPGTVTSTAKHRAAALKALQSGWIEPIPGGASGQYRLTNLGESLVGKLKLKASSTGGGGLGGLLDQAKKNEAASKKTKGTFNVEDIDWTKNAGADFTANANPEGCNQFTGPGCATAAHTGNDPSHARLNAASAASRANLASGHASSMSTDPGAFDAAEKAHKLGARALAGHGAAHGQKGGGSGHAEAAADAHTVANTKHLIAAARLGPENPAGAAHRTAAELHGLAAHRFRHSAHTLKMVGNMGTDDTSLLGRLIASVWNSLGSKADPTGNAKRQPSAGLDMTPAKACKILKDGEANGTPLTEKQRGMFGALCGKMTKNAAGEDEWTDGAGFDWQLYLVENGHAAGDVLDLDTLLTKNAWSEKARVAAALARKTSDGHTAGDHKLMATKHEAAAGRLLAKRGERQHGVPGAEKESYYHADTHQIVAQAHLNAAAALEKGDQAKADDEARLAKHHKEHLPKKQRYTANTTGDDETTNAPPSGDPADPDDYTGHQTEYPKNCPLCGAPMKGNACTRCAYKDAVTNEESEVEPVGTDNSNPEGCNQHKPCGTGTKVKVNLPGHALHGKPGEVVGETPGTGIKHVRVLSGETHTNYGAHHDAAVHAFHHSNLTRNDAGGAGETGQVTNSEDPDMATKTENVKYLVTNCECWKNKEASLNAMSEAELDSWRKYHEKARKNEAVVNSLPDLGLTVNSAGQVEKSWAGTVDFKDPNVREGVCKEMFNMTANDATVLVGFAKQVEQKERFNLVRKLTANIKDPKVQEARAKDLLKLDTQQLQDRVHDLELNVSENPVVVAPTGNAEDDQYQRFVQSYFSSGGREGAQGGPVPVGNRGATDKDDAPDVDGDPRPMPVMNYDDVSPTGVKLRKQRAG